MGLHRITAELDPLEHLKLFEEVEALKKTMWQRFTVNIVGATPLLVFNWQKGSWRDKVYFPPDGVGHVLFPMAEYKYHGFPTAILKSSLVNASGPVKGITKKQAAQMLFIEPLSPDAVVPIRHVDKKPLMPDEVEAKWLLKKNTPVAVKVARFDDWRMPIVVRITGKMTQSMLNAMLHIAGEKQGIGLCRPGMPKRGQIKGEPYGTFITAGSMRIGGET